jgi:hypothetical protein
MHDNWYPSNCKPIYQYYIPPGETVYLFPLMVSRNRERITLSTSYMPNLQNTMEYQVCNLMQFITIPYHQIVGLGVRVMAYNTIFINISVISCMAVGNRSTQRRPPTCCKSLRNFYHIMLYRVHLA